MSAAAARRKKQLQNRSKASSDPVQSRLDALLADPSLTEESVAYEALQLAQSSVRRNIKIGNFPQAVDVAYSTSLALLSKSGRVSVSSQLLAEFVKVLVETHTAYSEEWGMKFGKLDEAYRAALDADTKMDPVERGRLQRLHLQFLRKGLKWSNDLGVVRHGALAMHTLLGEHYWFMSCDSAVISADAEKGPTESAQTDDEEESDEAFSEAGLRNEAVTHYALAEKISLILEKLKALPGPTDEESKMGHTCPPCQRDALLTRSILSLLAIENLRDATILASSFAKDIETRSADDLKKSYLDKTDGKAPSHIMFVSMLLRICEKDIKTAPLFTWLVRNFGVELGTMHNPEKIKSYTTKIGKVYFDIQPPPSMMDMMENMMGMMGGGAGGAGGMNPAMMQNMMAAMQGGM